MISNEALLAIIAVIGTLAGAWAYGYKKEQDRKTLQLQRQIDEAKQQALESASLFNVLQRILTRMEQNDDRANEERKAWVRVVEQDTQVKTSLVEVVTQNTAATTASGGKVEALESTFKEFHKAMTEQFAGFKKQLETGLSEERLSPLLDVVFERFITRVQGVIVHAPDLRGEADDDTIRLPSIDPPIPLPEETEAGEPPVGKADG